MMQASINCPNAEMLECKTVTESVSSLLAVLLMMNVCWCCNETCLS